jgi:hypothetical protein
MRVAWLSIVPGLAAAVAFLLLLPLDMWGRPEYEAVYSGFDPALIYTRVSSSGRIASHVNVRNDSLVLVAIPGSVPTIHLVATPRDFIASFRARVVQPGGRTSTPLTVGVWNPREEVGYYLKFGPNYRITGHLTQSGRELRQVELGDYNPSEPYNLTVDLNRKVGRLVLTVRGVERPPTSSNRWAVLKGGPGNADYAELRSDPIKVFPGRRYAIGGTIKLAQGDGWYKLVLAWFDKNGTVLSHLNDWRPPDELAGWTRVRFAGVAPERAAYARMYLAAGGSATLYVTDLFVVQEDGARLNLLRNGNFALGSQGWEMVGPGAGPGEKPVIAIGREYALSDAILREEALGLFVPTHDVALSFWGEAQTSVAIAEVSHYVLRVPRQFWTGARVEDWRARGLLTVLLVASLSALALHIFIVTRKWMTTHVSHSSLTTASLVIRKETLSLKIVVASAVFIALAANVLIFRLGFHVYDFTNAKIWAYVSAYHGLIEVYRLPSLTAAASDSWNGVPWGTSSFPYGAVMAYFYAGVGWLYRVLFTEQGNLVHVTAMPGFVIKAVVLGFSLGNTGLVYLILRSLGLRRRDGFVSAAMILFNPAIWFVESVWGETHSVSLFPLLLSLFLALRGVQSGAWITLGFAMLTRPQLLVPGVFAALLYLLSWPAKRNLSAVSWTILLVFVVMWPFLFELSPAFPVTVLRETVGFANLSDPRIGRFIPISHGTLNVWPLVTAFTKGAGGPDRYLISSTTPLVGEFTYTDVSSWLLMTALLGLGAIAVRFRDVIRRDQRWIVHVTALSLLALLTLKTRIAPHHYNLVLPLLVLTRGTVIRRPLAPYIWVAALSFIELVSSWGYYSMVIPGLNLGRLVPYLDPRGSSLSLAFSSVMASNAFITFGSAVNVAAFVWVAWELLRGMSLERRRGV